MGLVVALAVVLGAIALALVALGWAISRLTLLVQAVVEANLAQEKEKGNAQDATKARDTKFDALDTWMADFRAIARVALDEHPQWLEKLGLGAVS